MSSRTRTPVPCDTTVLCTSSTILRFYSNTTPTTEISTLSLHDALPISILLFMPASTHFIGIIRIQPRPLDSVFLLRGEDRKSTRLNSSHVAISYAVFCLKKKKRCAELC